MPIRFVLAPIDVDTVGISRQGGRAIVFVPEGMSSQRFADHIVTIATIEERNYIRAAFQLPPVGADACERPFEYGLPWWPELIPEDLLIRVDSAMSG